MTETIVKVTKKLAEKIPKDSIIAVLNVFSDNKSTTEQVIGDIEYNMVNSGKFKIVDRRRLDQIRSEQNFQMSGDVSDDSAISIGNMLGANIVITGEISGVGTSKRLILKALDVKTAQITAMEREQL
jgi:curli biogenesis system outer membrane secretion channel CsgG